MGVGFGIFFTHVREIVTLGGSRADPDGYIFFGYHDEVQIPQYNLLPILRGNSYGSYFNFFGSVEFSASSRNTIRIVK